ncbi:MAG: hypothetical protein HFG67_00240 [Firmicutes bacterium]|nr:hypothetical protein [Bacillota bacterium]
MAENIAESYIKKRKRMAAASAALAAAVSAAVIMTSASAAFADTTGTNTEVNTVVGGNEAGMQMQADSDTQPKAAASAPKITEANIKDGLAFCSEYPVNLALDGAAVKTAEKDVPPVIITPSGETAGRTLVPARALFEAMGAEVKWINETQSVEITRNDLKVTLIIGSQTAIVNTEVKTLDVPALIIDHDDDYYGSTMIPVRFAAEALGCDVKWEDSTRTVAVTSPENINSGNQNPNRGDTGNREEPGGNTNDIVSAGNQTGNTGTPTGNGTVIIDGFEFPEYDMNSLPLPSENAKTKLVAIDIGHGGRDAGSTGHKGQADAIDEKDLTLAVGLAVRDYLKSAGIPVYMIRETDEYIEVKEHAYMANNAGAELFVSIHINSSEYEAPNGTETHYYTKKDEEGRSEYELYGIGSAEVAKTIQKEMIKALGTVNRGTKSSPELIVLNRTVMPAVLIEGAFLSNEKDFSMMKTQEFTERYGFACAKAIINSLNEAFPD